MKKYQNTITLSMPRLYFEKMKMANIKRKDLTNIMRCYIEQTYLDLYKAGLLSYDAITRINTVDPD